MGSNRQVKRRQTSRLTGKGTRGASSLGLGRAHPVLLVPALDLQEGGNPMGRYKKEPGRLSVDFRDTTAPLAHVRSSPSHMDPEARTMGEEESKNVNNGHSRQNDISAESSHDHVVVK